MPLIFEGKTLDQADINRIVKDFLPKGKDTTVTFVKSNSKPLMFQTDKGGTVMKAGGTFPVSTTCIAIVEGRKGNLTYYESEQQLPDGKGGLAVNREPKFLYFSASTLTIDPKVSDDKMAYLLLNRHRKGNAESFGIPAEFEMIDTRDKHTKSAQRGGLKKEVYALITAADAEKGKPKLQSIYMAMGYTDFLPLRKAKEWDTIMSPIYDLAESDPQKLKSMFEDASLEKSAHVREALEYGVIKEQSGAYYWGSNQKKIWSAPAGLGDEAFPLFVEWLVLKDASGVFDVIKKELLRAQAEDFIS